VAGAAVHVLKLTGKASGRAQVFLWLIASALVLAAATAASACSQPAHINNSQTQQDNTQQGGPIAAVSTIHPATQEIFTQAAFAPEDSYSTTVSKVLDGDTIVAPIDGKEWNIRLIGIDTPEASTREQECGGAEATAFLGELIPPRTQILLTRDEEAYDIYDRLLAYVFRASDNLFVNLAMAKYGMASELSFDLNTQFLPHFKRAESEARQNQLGVWGQCGGTDTPL